MRCIFLTGDNISKSVFTTVREIQESILVLVLIIDRWHHSRCIHHKYIKWFSPPRTNSPRKQRHKTRSRKPNLITSKYWNPFLQSEVILWSSTRNCESMGLAVCTFGWFSVPEFIQSHFYAWVQCKKYYVSRRLWRVLYGTGLHRVN